VNIMRPLTRHQRAGCRRWAVRELGILRDPLALDDLISVLGDDQPLVRAEARFSLGMLGRAVPAARHPMRTSLAALAERDPSREVRMSAQWAVEAIAA
jgi:hypothetical protein